MADRYLLESGAPDGYLLEDSSGVLLLEGSDFSPFGDVPIQPVQPRRLYTLPVAVLATIGIVAPVFTPTPPLATAGTSSLEQQRSVQYQALAFTHFTEAAPAEEVTLDKWYQPSPDPRPVQRAPQVTPEVRIDIQLDASWLSDWPLTVVRHRVQHSQPTDVLFQPPAAEDVTLDKWATDSPITLRPFEIIHSQPVLVSPEVVTLDKWLTLSPTTPRPVRVEAILPSMPDFVPPPPPEVITYDKWATDSPFPVRHPIPYYDTFTFDVFPIPNPEPPEPPEPEPEPPRPVKPMVIRVRHINTPPGGFNTIYYIDDEDR